MIELLGTVAMNLNRCIYIFKVAFLLLLCSGCGPQAVNDKPHTHAEFSTYQKPGADIRLLTRQVTLNEVGDTLLVNLELRVGHSKGVLSVRFGSSDGVEVLSDKDIQIVLDKRGDIHFPVDLYAVSKGRHYLPINAVVELPGGQRLHRAFSVVVQVGRVDPSNKSRGDEKQAPTQGQDGRPIKVLPATEDIR